MSSHFSQIRRHSSDPHAERIKELAERIADQESKNVRLDSEDLRSTGKMMHSTIKINDERLKFTTTLQSSGTSGYELPMEPDFDSLKLWYMMDHLGSTIRDLSGFNHHGKLLGHPSMQRAGIDMGFLQNNIDPAFPAISFNTADDPVNATEGESIIVPDHPDLQIKDATSGFSITFRFFSIDWSLHKPEEGVQFNRRFANKRDDPNYGYV
ncbi:MAG: hypothetical protein ACPKPY_05570, partial [Nitrososphaeraceae archaeon]